MNYKLLGGVTMKKRIILMASLLAMVMIFAGAIEAQATRVAVLGFEAADSSWFESSSREQEVLEFIREEFTDKLADVEDYTVYSSRRTKALLEELNARPGRRPTHSIMNQLRGRTNSDLFAYGSIERIHVEEKNQFNVGPVRFSEVELIVDLNVEMINARTNRISETYTGTGRISHTGINIVDSRGDQIRLHAFDDDALERAITRAIDNLIADIKGEKVEEEISERVVEAQVVSIVGDRLVINKGSRDGLEVGQKANIVRYSDDGNSSLAIATAIVDEIDNNSASIVLDTINRRPQVNDYVYITIEEFVRRVEPDRDPIRVVDTRNFRIEILNAELSGNRVTISGVATAKSNNVDLRVLLSSTEFFDHESNRTQMTGKRVSIGGWSQSSSGTPSITETFQRNETRDITWSFTNVPANADKLARVTLWLETENEGNISIDFRDLEL